MIFFVIAFFATFVGAISGLGGGVIIKPFLDLFTNIDVSTVSLLSTVTVFSMSVTAIAKQVSYKTKINFKLGTIIAFGGIFGGYFGNIVFNMVLNNSKESGTVIIIQNLMMIVFLAIVLLYINYYKEKLKFNFKNQFLIFLTGAVLGAISSFIGIGGGPINLMVLILFFSMTTKEATVNSLILIFFSQLSKIVTIGVTTGFVMSKLSPLVFMIPAGVIGGILGSSVNKKISSHTIIKIFNIVNIFVIVVALVNVIMTS